MNWWDDHHCVAQLLYWLAASDTITTAVDAADVVAKPRKWQAEYDAMRRMWPELEQAAA